jgi:acyl carrier protein
MSTLQDIQTLIVKEYELDLNRLSADTPLEDYGLDSLALAEIMFTIEEHFKVKLPDDGSIVQTVSGLADAIDGLLAIKAKAA